MKQFILMSDIIGSSNHHQELLIERFKQCTSYINKKYIDHLISPLTITLGDEFQGIIANLKSSIDVIIDLEEFIINNNFSLKLRYVLIYGEIETNINNHIAFEMLGKGLTKARKLLNNNKSKEERFYIDIDNANCNTIINNSFEIYQNIIDKWKLEKDYQLISSFLKNYDYKIVAEHLNKNRSLIWKREKTLNMSSYFAVKEILNVAKNLNYEYCL